MTDDLLSRHPLIVVTGAPATGKTELCQLIGRENSPRTFPFIVRTPPLDIDSMLTDLVERIGVLPAGSRRVGLTHSTLLAVWRRFIDSLPPLGARAILILDEAHRLDPLLIEQIYSLTTTASGRQALQIVFVGEPALDGILRADNLKGFDGSFARRYELTPITKLKALRWGYAVAVTPPLATIALTAWWSIHHDVVPVVKPGIAIQDKKTESAYSQATPPAPTVRRAGSRAPITQAIPASKKPQAAVNETLSLEAVLRQAETARAQPDVRALTRLRSQVAARATQSVEEDKQEIASTLQILDRYLDEARRLQLEIDRRRLTASSSEF